MIQPMTRVGVVVGGSPIGRRRSLMSAQFILEALDIGTFEPVLLCLDEVGRWRLPAIRQIPEMIRRSKEGLADFSGREVFIASGPEGSLGSESAHASAERTYVDVAFPLIYEGPGAHGVVQGLLELMKVPYVGTGLLGSALGSSPETMRSVLAAAAIPTFGQDDDELTAHGIAGTHQLHCGILGGSRPTASTIGESLAASAFDLQVPPHNATSRVHRIPADLSRDQVNSATQLALAAFRALNCRGMALVDILLKGNDIAISGIITAPDLVEMALFPTLWRATGISPRELVTRLVLLALDEGKRNQSRRQA